MCLTETAVRHCRRRDWEWGLEMVQYLVERGADVNQRAWAGSILLEWALDSEDVVGFLIEAGADVNAIDSSGAVITDAVLRGGVGPLRALL